jgi:hypothetical protein
LTRRRLEAELDEELCAHLELETGKYIASGIPLEPARRRANVALGSRVRVTEECRDQWGGVNTTVFSFRRAILLATLPVPNPQELCLASRQYPGSPGFAYFSFPDVQQMQDAARANAELTSFADAVEYHAGDEAGTTSTA